MLRGNHQSAFFFGVTATSGSALDVQHFQKPVGKCRHSLPRFSISTPQFLHFVISILHVLSFWECSQNVILRAL
jgi:hypothetical protein